MENGWKAYKDMREMIGPELVKMQDYTQSETPYLQMIDDLFSKERSPFNKVKSFTADDIADDDPEYDWNAKTAQEEADDMLYQSRDT